MPVQHINVGTVPNDGTGDKIRDAFIKANENWDFIEGIIPPTQVIVYTPVTGGLTENVIFADCTTVQQNIILGSAVTGSPQKTVIYKIDNSTNRVHVTTTAVGGFAEDVAEFYMSVKGECLVFDANSGEDKWYRRNV